MIIKNNKIVECTDNELFEYYLKRNFDNIFSFIEFKERCMKNGTKVLENNKC